MTLARRRSTYLRPWRIVDGDYLGGFTRAEFYKDFLIPSGARYVLGGYVHETVDLRVFIVFNHLVGQDEFDSTQRIAMRRLMPHLQRVMRMTLSVETLRAGSHAGEVGLTALGQAVFTLDGIGRIAFANQVAEAMLHESNVLHARSQRLMGKGSNVCIEVRGGSRSNAAHTKERKRLAMGYSKCRERLASFDSGYSALD